jgi:hypothetical protein
MIAPVTGARAVIATAVVLLGVSACSGDDPEPKVAPPESSSPSAPSTSPVAGSTAPTMPAEALGTGATAARAFISHWIATLNYAIESGDTSALRSISDDSCKACDRIAKTIDGIYSHGGSMVGGTWSPKSLRALPPDRGADWAGYLTARISAQSVTGADGGRHDYDGGPGYMYAYVVDAAQGWRMIYLDIPI